MNIRTRIAPSPTGPLHIGTARTALFNYLFARQEKGVFILRIDDTDKERNDPRFEEDILTALRWLGLEWDEKFKQSDRLNIYCGYLEQLLLRQTAFWCPHMPDELSAEKGTQMEQNIVPRHVCSFRNREAQGSAGPSF